MSSVTYLKKYSSGSGSDGCGGGVGSIRARRGASAAACLAFFAGGSLLEARLSSFLSGSALATRLLRMSSMVWRPPPLLAGLDSGAGADCAAGGTSALASSTAGVSARSLRRVAARE